MVINTFLKIVIGRQFGYDRALEIVQDEQYLEDSDFDEIKRLDIIKKTGEFNPDLNLPEEQRKEWFADFVGMPQGTQRTHSPGSPAVFQGIHQSSIYEMAYDSRRPIDSIDDYPKSLRRHSRQACPTCCPGQCAPTANIDCNVCGICPTCCPTMSCPVAMAGIAVIALTDCSGCSNPSTVRS